MKPLHLLRNPNILSALHRTFTTASRARPIHPSPLFNLLTRPPNTRRPFSNLLTRSFPHRKPLSTKRPYTTRPNRPPPPPLTLSQRLRKLSREYGWSAFGVYMLLSALDFPFCFAAVRYLGADRIGHYEHVVIEWVGSGIPDVIKEAWRGWKMAVSGSQGEAKVGGEGDRVGEVGVAGFDGHGIKEAEKRNESGNASIWTQLALAYAIHKSFIFIRVPLTVAVTPKVVKVLRGWGWDIGKRRPKGVK